MIKINAKIRFFNMPMFLLFFILALFSVPLYAQETPPALLTEEIIDSILNNFDKIITDLNGLDSETLESFESIFKELNGDSITELIPILRTAVIPKKVDDIFARYGTGARGFEKFMLMLVAAFVVRTEKMQAMQKEEKMYESPYSNNNDGDEDNDDNVYVYDDTEADDANNEDDEYSGYDEEEELKTFNTIKSQINPADLDLVRKKIGEFGNFGLF